MPPLFHKKRYTPPETRGIEVIEIVIDLSKQRKWRDISFLFHGRIFTKYLKSTEKLSDKRVGGKLINIFYLLNFCLSEILRIYWNTVLHLIKFENISF